MSPLATGLLAGLLLFGVVAIIGWRLNRGEMRRMRLSEALAGPVGRTTRGAPSVSPLERKLRQLEKEQKENQRHTRQTLEEKIQEAGWVMGVRGFTIMSVILGVLTVALAWLLKVQPLLFYCAIPIGFIGLPRMVLNYARGRRRRRFLRDLADALDAITRGVRSGLPVTEAMAGIARDFEGPVAVEFSRAVDEQALGLTMGESLERIAKRVPLTEMRMLAIAITIQSRTGGSLAETLNNLADVIRGRERLKRKVKAVSSEARISAMIIGALPICVSGGLYAVNPDYVLMLFNHPVGKALVTGCAIWMSLGIFIMWKMVNFKV